jgi:hypothetical protein
MKSMVKEVVHQLAFSILDAEFRKIPGFEGRKPINVRSSWGFVAGLWYF